MTALEVPPIEVIAAVLVAYPLGQITHELAHLLFAMVFRASPTLHLSLRNQMVVSFDADLPEWRERAVKTAPIISGLCIGAGSVLTVGWPPVAWVGLPSAVWWVAHTWTGGAEDFDWLEPWYDGLEHYEQEAVKSGGVALLAMGVLFSPVGSHLIGWYISLILLFASMGGAVLAGIEAEHGYVRDILAEVRP